MRFYLGKCLRGRACWRSVCQDQPWPEKGDKTVQGKKPTKQKQLCKEMECIQKGLWMQFQKRMNLHSGATIFSSVEIFQHAPLHDKTVKRGEEIGL